MHPVIRVGNVILGELTYSLTMYAGWMATTDESSASSGMEVTPLIIRAGRFRQREKFTYNQNTLLDHVQLILLGKR